MKRSLLATFLLAAMFSFGQQAPKSDNKPADTKPEVKTEAKADTAAPPAADAKPADTKAADTKTDAKPDAKPAQPAQTAAAAGSKGCLAVKPIGSHAFRNIMLAGVAGALISKQQYQVVDVVDYPSHVGTKFHGNDLQTISSNGTKVVILDKKYTDDDVKKACH